MEQGNPVYRTEKPLQRFGLTKALRIDEALRLRVKAEGIVVDSQIEHNYSVLLDVFLDLPLFRAATRQAGAACPSEACPSCSVRDKRTE